MENSSCDQTYNVGDLVWIVRGDGMWWPAQVLNPINELREGSDVSVKAIKLLGKDVNERLDCYNLEKVKPFRSTEFIFCIALATVPSTSTKPSSARDLAILEALEVERAQLEAAESSSDAVNTKNLEQSVPRDFDLNIVPSIENADLPLIEETGNNSNNEGHKKRLRGRRARELDDLLGVGIELTTSKRQRKLLPHAREFLESVRNRRRRASKKLKVKESNNIDTVG